MNLISILFIAIGLSMDAFAVSIAKGMSMKREYLLKYALIFGISFGVFQGLMPLIGWWIGTYFQSLISSFDHWIAFVLLAFIGGNMIYASFHGGEDTNNDSLSLNTILMLSIATSIDALAVGVSFAFLKVDILVAILLIGCTTCILSFIAVYIGNKLGGLLERYAGILGGVILLVIGFKILLEHTLFS